VPSVVAQDEWKFLFVDDLLVDAGLDFVLENIDDSFDDSFELVIDCVLENADDSLDDPIEKSSLLVAWPTSLMSSAMDLPCSLLSSDCFEQSSLCKHDVRFRGDMVFFYATWGSHGF